MEAGGPDRVPDANQRIQKLLATVKKSELLDETQTAEIETFLGQYHDVFSLEDGKRRETDLTEMVIETGDSPPQRVPARRMPLAVHREVVRQLKDMQRAE